MLFIEPGSPWKNGYNESFNGKLRDELLNGEICYSLAEAAVLVEQWSVSLPSHPDLLAEKLQTRSILTLHLVSFQGVRSHASARWKRVAMHSKCPASYT